jgi:hypothetical protein
MTCHRPLLACIVITLCILCGSTVLFAEKEEAEAKRLARIIEGQQRQPLILFVAKGAPNACGTGCSEWIAAEGKIDKDSGQRVKEFLASLPRRDLPIFFNSTGGMTRAAMQIGATLRENRMSVGLGRTIPEGCDRATRVSDSCRRLMQSKPQHAARLVVDGAQCASACVLAIAGGSFRRIGRGAQLGIHALRQDIPRTVAIDKAYDQLKRYLLEMGVDPGIIEAGSKVNADDIHFMTPDEISRFGVETRDDHETPWFLSSEASQSYTISKSTTETKGLSAAQPRTTVIKIACNVGDAAVRLSVRRELWPSEAITPVAIQFGIGGDELPFGISMSLSGYRTWNTYADFDRLLRMAAQPKIDVTSKPPESSFALSTLGLTEALQDLRKRCQAMPRGQTAGGADGDQTCNGLNCRYH